MRPTLRLERVALVTPVYMVLQLARDAAVDIAIGTGGLLHRLLTRSIVRKQWWLFSSILL